MSAIFNLLQDRSTLLFTINLGAAEIITEYSGAHCKIHHIFVPREEDRQGAIAEIKANRRWWDTRTSYDDGREYFKIHAEHETTATRVR
jgi:hypothetical protein